MSRNDGTVLLENVRILFRNFAGKEGKYNREGDRSFAVLLEDDLANQMETDGWNVKWLKPNDDYADPQAYLPVAVFFGLYPPRINLITGRGRTPLHESEIELLDWVDIRMVDLVIRPNNWSINGKTGKKAYLKTMYVTIEEDPLDAKYSEAEDLPSRSGRIE